MGFGRPAPKVFYCAVLLANADTGKGPAPANILQFAGQGCMFSFIDNPLIKETKHSAQGEPVKTLHLSVEIIHFWQYLISTITFIQNQTENVTVEKLEIDLILQLHQGLSCR